jgi:spore maturation protein CgeB
VLVARDGAEVAEHVQTLTPERARAIGEAGRARILKEHTYERRGAELDRLLRDVMAAKRERSAA